MTRVTTDVDALNEMFTSGVVSIFEDICCVGRNSRRHVSDELEAGADHLCGASVLAYATKLFRIECAIRSAEFGVDCAHRCAPAGHVSGMVVLRLFNREKKAFKTFPT